MDMELGRYLNGLVTRHSIRDELRVLNAVRKKLYHFGLSPVACLISQMPSIPDL